MKSIPEFNDAICISRSKDGRGECHLCVASDSVKFIFTRHGNLEEKDRDGSVALAAAYSYTQYFTEVRQLGVPEVQVVNGEL